MHEIILSLHYKEIRGLYDSEIRGLYDNVIMYCTSPIPMVQMHREVADGVL